MTPPPLAPQGLRWAVLLGSFGTMVGSWIKVGSLDPSPERFLVTFAGQTVTAASQIFILGIPPKLAAVWFGPNQVSSACAIGVFGNQVSWRADKGSRLSCQFAECDEVLLAAKLVVVWWRWFLVSL